MIQSMASTSPRNGPHQSSRSEAPAPSLRGAPALGQRATTRANIVASGVTITSDSGKSICRELTLSALPGDKIAVIGAEGSGKSTLLEFLSGSPRDGFRYSGTVSELGAGGFLPQQLPHKWLHSTAEDFCFLKEPSQDPSSIPWERYGDLQAALRQVDLPESILHQSMGVLSGGETVRVQLAKLLFGHPSHLLLDEPTNNLDLQSVRWLQNFITASEVPILFVSHDETLIRHAATGILYLAHRAHDNRCFSYFSGEPYDTFIQRLHEARDSAEDRAGSMRRTIKKLKIRKVEQQNKLIGAANFAKAEGAADKGRMMRAAASGSTGVAAMGTRIENLQQTLDDMEIPHVEDYVKIDFPTNCTVPGSKQVLVMDDQSLSVPDRILVPHFDLKIVGPEKVGILGSNGVGKSTLLHKICSSKLPPGIQLGYMPQDFLEVLTDANESALKYLQRLGATENMARTLMTRMGLVKTEMDNPVGALSGGQRGKLIIMHMVVKGANFLVLDEPTRNLSPITAPVFREQLRDFPGAVLAVSHDRSFLHEVCDRVLELSPTGLHEVRKESLLD